MGVNYSIESALPYTDTLNDLSRRFTLAYDVLTKRIESENKRSVQVLLVDDVTNDGGERYDLDAYTAASILNNPDTLVMRETMLNGLADSVFADMQTNLSEEEKAAIKTNRGYSSPFYIAVWTLLRLGYVTHPDFTQDRISERIINILPESFRDGEEESLAIVRKSRFPEAADRVEYEFIPD